MPPRTVSRDLKASILILYYKQNFTVKEICGLLGIKKSLAYKTLLYSLTYRVIILMLAQEAIIKFSTEKISSSSWPL